MIGDQTTNILTIQRQLFHILIPYINKKKIFVKINTIHLVKDATLDIKKASYY